MRMKPSSSGSSHIQHMQKALTQMNLQLHHVVTDITGATGMAIIRAIVAGERDPAMLATHRDPRCRASWKRSVRRSSAMIAKSTSLP
ncbi:hypothetical protein EH240_14665 [Mesorhizobium tamadayense]|uniref:Uncharacterized protein n=1 Tax=Mesorhizobium tamadayense TaxID=425306 RepID=A0A3P3FSC9_9HYPH|nr:hypothetical protein [Mesorhizobium tamadayense]RRI01531.1 hypothetical protein EH240_14665 [Mesorhizobium tamadayense]